VLKEGGETKKNRLSRTTNEPGHFTGNRKSCVAWGDQPTDYEVKRYGGGLLIMELKCATDKDRTGRRGRR